MKNGLDATLVFCFFGYLCSYVRVSTSLSQEREIYKKLKPSSQPLSQITKVNEEKKSSPSQLTEARTTGEDRNRCTVQNSLWCHDEFCGIIKLRILTLDGGRYAFDVPHSGACKRTRLTHVLKRKTRRMEITTSACSLAALPLRASLWTRVTYRCRYKTDSIEAVKKKKERKKRLFQPLCSSDGGCRFPR